jgi:hypothetical protein
MRSLRSDSVVGWRQALFVVLSIVALSVPGLIALFLAEAPAGAWTGPVRGFLEANPELRRFVPFNPSDGPEDDGAPPALCASLGGVCDPVIDPIERTVT